MSGPDRRCCSLQHAPVEMLREHTWAHIPALEMPRWVDITGSTGGGPGSRPATNDPPVSSHGGGNQSPSVTTFLPQAGNISHLISSPPSKTRHDTMQYSPRPHGDDRVSRSDSHRRLQHDLCTHGSRERGREFTGLDQPQARPGEAIPPFVSVRARLADCRCSSNTRHRTLDGDTVCRLELRVVCPASSCADSCG
jgi:hypothetical protein